QPDEWFGLKYNLNLYRGCQHQCIYCDSRSSCYQIENFADIQVKVNAIELLAEALPRKRVRGTIGTGSMNDPYMPVERKYQLTRRALQVMAEHQFPVHILTKSDLVLRDLQVLQQINRVFAAVSFTITTPDDDLGKKLEPGAARVSERFSTMRALAEAGIHTGITLMPVLPFIEDMPESISRIVELAAEHGASYILPSFGMTLRDGSRQYYYAQLDRLFPGMKDRYIRQYGERYQCEVPNAAQLSELFNQQCQHYGIATRMPIFKPETIKNSRQMRLF
ncbi:MAG: radical SAM protein, partial [Anaerolineales bacterium]|nr:radical SAM protein [Anaerolineales bacterium]